MQRFLIFVGVAVVAAAMYVAASPASQQAKAPSAKQFSALKKQVAALKKDETAVKKLSIALAQIVGGCYLDSNGNLVVLPVSQFGTASSGFVFGAPNTTTGQTARSALDVNASSPTAGPPGGQSVVPQLQRTEARHWPRGRHSPAALHRAHPLNL